MVEPTIFRKVAMQTMQISINLHCFIGSNDGMTDQFSAECTVTVDNFGRSTGSIPVTLMKTRRSYFVHLRHRRTGAYRKRLSSSRSRCNRRFMCFKASGANRKVIKMKWKSGEPQSVIKLQLGKIYR